MEFDTIVLKFYLFGSIQIVEVNFLIVGAIKLTFGAKKIADTKWIKKSNMGLALVCVQRIVSHN